MDYLERIRSEWKKSFESMGSSNAFKRFAKGDITIEHYKSVLREIFHYTRENPQLQAAATVAFKGSQRDLVKSYLKHALSEYGHDQLALNDLKTLGTDISRIPFERPLASTSALIAFAYYNLDRNPLVYLGYVFHLEFMATAGGGAYMTWLSNIGVPAKAMTFIRDHAVVDIAHNKLMEDYLSKLVRNEDDVESVIYGAKTTAKLYELMIQEAFDTCEAKSEKLLDADEVRRSFHEADVEAKLSLFRGLATQGNEHRVKNS